MSGTENNHSPRHSSNNPQPRRAGRPIISSPWNQIVRGVSEPVAAAAPSPPPSSPTSSTVVESAPVTAASLPVEVSSSVGGSSENVRGSNGSPGRRPAWNNPSNGAAREVSPVMDAVSWPALSKSTKPTVKSSESSEGLTDESSAPQLQGTGSSTPSSQTQVSDNSITPTMVPTRQKSAKNNGSSPSSNGGHLQQSAQASIAVTGPHNTFPMGHTQRSGFVSQPHNFNGHPQRSSSFRNRNGGPHQRGDGPHHHTYGNGQHQRGDGPHYHTYGNGQYQQRDTPHHHNYVNGPHQRGDSAHHHNYVNGPHQHGDGSHHHYNRREQDRGNQIWSSYRNINDIETHLHVGVSGYIRPLQPHSSAQLPLSPAPMLPYGGHIGFHGPTPESMGTAPYGQPLHPHGMMYYQVLDHKLLTSIAKQIDHYFSVNNLIIDTYLRENMDDQGWVPIKLIAGFKKIVEFTDNIQLILYAARLSSVVEVQDDKIRTRNEWWRWPLPPGQFSNVRTPRAFGKFGHEMLTEQFQNIVLEKATENEGDGGLDAQPEALQNRPTFGHLNSSLRLSGGEVADQVRSQGSDLSSARN